MAVLGHFETSLTVSIEVPIHKDIQGPKTTTQGRVHDY